MFYDEYNFVVLMPKVDKVAKVDPYAAISFLIQDGKNNEVKGHDV